MDQTVNNKYDSETWKDWRERPRVHPLKPLFNKTVPYMRICAPMVRYSKLPFRELVRLYDVDLAYTPMILSDVFKHSEISRDVEFRTNRSDSPVVVQFAASNACDLADAAELVSRYSNGVDLNCGCPQKWAISEGIGSSLMEKPDQVKEMIRLVKTKTSGVKMEDGSSFPCSVKIRIHADLKKTVEYVKRMEMAGADWITVHGRTSKQRNTEPVVYEGIRIAKESVSIPVFANGNIYTMEDVEQMIQTTGADGVMSARGLLKNPALFSGMKSTPIDAVRTYMKLGLQYGTTSFIYHHHLMYMLESSMSRAEKKRFNSLTSIPCILDYMEEHYNVVT